MFTARLSVSCFMISACWTLRFVTLRKSGSSFGFGHYMSHPRSYSGRVMIAPQKCPVTLCDQHEGKCRP